MSEGSRAEEEKKNSDSLCEQVNVNESRLTIKKDYNRTVGEQDHYHCESVMKGCTD